MKAYELARRIAVPGLCVALFCGLAACGGSGHGDRTALDAQLKNGPFKDFHHFVDDQDKPLSAGQADQRVDCFAEALTAYGDKKQVAAYAAGGAGYLAIGISKPADFKAAADTCVGKQIAGRYVPPYPSAAFTH
jgi:hypothetical protein